VLIVALAAVSAVAGGVAGYGTGALMPLVLVPLVGAAPVVPIIAISAMFTNTARVAAFRRSLDRRRAVIALLAALPTCGGGADERHEDQWHQGAGAIARDPHRRPPTPPPVGR